MAITPFSTRFPVDAAGDFPNSTLPRLTLSRVGGTTDPLTAAMAEALFVSHDDLVFTEPSDLNAPVQQVYLGEKLND